jgi:predicted phosphodiesterase
MQDRNTRRRKASFELLAKYPDASKRRIAYLLYSEHPDIFDSAEHARQHVRHLMSKAKIGDEIDMKRPRKGSKQYFMPKAKSEPWEPYYLKGKCVAVFADCHFPVHDPEAIETAVEHVKKNYEPDVVILNGDFADALEFSTWAKSPKAIQTQDNLKIVREGLLWFRHQFPNARFVYKFGNHEDRLERFCWSKAPELVGVPHISWEGLLTVNEDLVRVDDLKDIVWVADERPVMAGDLAIFHGHEFSGGSSSPDNPAKSVFFKAGGSILVGHHHKSSSQADWRKEAACWSVGCLCFMNPKYARMNKWNLGHAVVEVGKSKAFSVSNFKIQKDRTVTKA